jgi:hypothetical protein
MQRSSKKKKKRKTGVWRGAEIWKMRKHRIRFWGWGIDV